jgi:hypothetical protein
MDMRRNTSLSAKIIIYAIIIIGVQIGVAASLTMPKLPLSVPESKMRNFDVIRNGNKIGTHNFSFGVEGDQLIVEVKALIEYKLLFIRLYFHDHRSREVWQDGRLQRMTSFTDDNGEKISLQVGGDAGGFAITSDIDGETTTRNAPANAFPASFWSAAALERDQAVSTIRGGVDPIQSEYLGEETVAAQGRKVRAKHYKMTGGIKRDLWFDPADNMALVYLRFAASDGSTVEYVLQ